MLSEQQKIFNKIAKTITDNQKGSGHSVIDMFIDVFVTEDGTRHDYIVVKYIGGAIAVRNCAMNSLSLNLKEAAKLLNGGYYSEVEKYKELKAMEIKI